VFETTTRWHMILALVAMVACSALVNAQVYPTTSSTESSSSYDEALDTSDITDTSDATRSPEESELTTYQNSTYGFSISYPADWMGTEADPNEMNLVAGFLAPGEDANNPENYVTVQIEKLPSKPVITLAQYTQTVISNLKRSYPDFKEVSSKDTLISDSPGKELVYTMSSGRVSYQILLATTIKNGKAYVMTFYALADRYNQLQESARQIIDSFEFTDAQASSPAIGKMIGVPITSSSQT